MIRLFGRRTSQVRIGAGADTIVFGITLPSDTVVHDIKFRITTTFVAGETLNQAQFCGLGCEAWILPVLDPDAAQGYENLWDTLVPKDTDVQTLDLDTGAADATPFWEPGEMDWSALFDVGLRPERLYGSYRFMRLGDSSLFTFQDNQTPFAIKWVPGTVFRTNIRRRLRVRQPSVLLIAIANPSTDDVTTNVEAVLTEAQLPQVKYIEEVLERALLHTLGLVEAGAETPWEEATTLIQQHLDPDVHEETASSFVTGNTDALGTLMVDHSVPGRLDKLTISGGRK